MSNDDSHNTYVNEATKQVKGLYISAFVFACIGMAQKLLTMFNIVDPVKIAIKMLTEPLHTIPIADRVGKVILGLTDSFIPLAVLLLAVAIVLQNDLLEVANSTAETARAHSQ